MGISQGNKELEQIRVCAEIGLECIHSNPRRRPTTQHILDRLYQMESTHLSTETSENSTSVTMTVSILYFTSLSKLILDCSFCIITP